MHRYLIMVALILAMPVVAQDNQLSPLEQLGKLLFFDDSLSDPPGMSCATCHSPEVGFTGPDSEINRTMVAYPGAVATLGGNRKPPTAAYGGDSPVLHYDQDEGVWIGGMFFDGRATGWTLDDPLAEQAQGPFLNPLEHNLASAQMVCDLVNRSDYVDRFEQIWGAGSLDCENDVQGTYDRIARAIAAFERSAEVNPFTSKYDYFLAGKVELTAEEKLGLEVFENQGKCSECHPSQPGPDNSPPLFTDFTYDNLGIPRFDKLPFYTLPAEFNPAGKDWVDSGLAGFLETTAEYKHHVADNLGKHKVPTLRNVDMRPSPDFVKVFGHNGYFRTLYDIVHFYNTRDTEEWPPPEVSENVNTDELGDLGLTLAQEQALVAFLKMLSDEYVLEE